MGTALNTGKYSSAALSGYFWFFLIKSQLFTRTETKKAKLKSEIQLVTQYSPDALMTKPLPIAAARKRV